MLRMLECNTNCRIAFSIVFVIHSFDTWVLELRKVWRRRRKAICFSLPMFANRLLSKWNSSWLVCFGESTTAYLKPKFLRFFRNVYFLQSFERYFRPSNSETERDRKLDAFPTRKKENFESAPTRMLNHFIISTQPIKHTHKLINLKREQWREKVCLRHFCKAPIKTLPKQPPI